MAQRIPSALMVLCFAYLTVICVRDVLDDLGLTAAIPSGRAAGGPVLILLDIACTVVCVVWISVFLSLFLGSKKADRFG
jgi:hypothetical protein